MMKYLILAALALQGCGVSYRFEPFSQKEESYTKQEIAAAFKQRDAAIEGLAKTIEELKKNDKKAVK